VSFREFSCHKGVGDLALRRFINVHLLNLLDGTPHELPPQKVLRLDLGHEAHEYRITEKKISESRIAIAAQFSTEIAGGYSTVLISWDWRTGKVVSNFPP
jgi:hypothetical protein